jgi:hypothetical protein
MGLFDKRIKEKDSVIPDQISGLLTDKGIDYKKDGTVFNFQANVDERIIGCNLVCDMDNSLLKFSAIFYDKVPNDKISGILELMARINGILAYGAFAFNFNHNMITCITTIPFDNAVLSYEQLERLCFNNLVNVNDYQGEFEELLKSTN